MQCGHGDGGVDKKDAESLQYLAQKNQPRIIEFSAYCEHSPLTASILCQKCEQDYSPRLRNLNSS